MRQRRNFTKIASDAQIMFLSVKNEIVQGFLENIT